MGDRTMKDFTKFVVSRVGICRSGTEFDIPSELDDKVKILKFWSQYGLDDRIDIFCMSEARVIAISKFSRQSLADESLMALNHFIWNGEAINELRPHLEKLGL